MSDSLNFESVLGTVANIAGYALLANPLTTAWGVALIAAGTALTYVGAKKASAEALRRAQAAQFAQAIIGNYGGATANHLIVFGRRRVGGVLAVYGVASDNGESNNLLMIGVVHSISHAGGGAGIGGIWLNDTYIDTADINGSGDVTLPEYISGGQYLVNVTHYRGHSTQAADTELATMGLDPANAYRRGLAWTKFKLRKTNDETFQNAFKTGIPVCGVEHLGILCYDPRLDSTNGGLGGHRPDDPTTWNRDTQNPALHAVTYALMPRSDGGCGEPPERIDFPSVIAAANICEEDIPYYSLKRYECNVVLSTESLLKDNMQEILSAMAGAWIPKGNKLYLYAGAYRTPTLTIDSTWLRGGASISTRTSIPDLYNAVRVTLIDEEDKYQAQEGEPKISAAYESQDGGERLWRDLSLTSVTNYTQADLIAQMEHKRSRYQMTIDLPLNLRGLDLAVWDTVYVNFGDELVTPSDGRTFDGATSALLAQMDEPPPGWLADAIDDLIVGLKSDSLWAKMDALYWHGLHTLQAGSLNWKSPSTDELQPAGAGPDFVAYSHVFGGAVGDYLSTAYTYGSGVLVLDSAHIGHWIVNHVSGGSTAPGGTAGGGMLYINPRETGTDQPRARVHSGSAVYVANTATVGSTIGHWMVCRTSSTNLRAYQNAVSPTGGSAVASTSTALATGLFVTARQASETSAFQVRCTHFGQSMAPADVTALYARFSAFDAAIKAGLDNEISNRVFRVKRWKLSYGSDYGVGVDVVLEEENADIYVAELPVPKPTIVPVEDGAQTPVGPGGETGVPVADGVDLSWDLPSQLVFVIHIYRSTVSTSGPWTRIATVRAPATSYHDPITAPGTYYYYFEFVSRFLASVDSASVTVTVATQGVLASELVGNSHGLRYNTSGIRLGGGRNIFALRAANKSAAIQTTSPLTTSLFSGAARISIASHTVQMDFGTVSYNAGTIDGLSFSTKYYVYCDDPTLSGGAVTYVATTNAATTTANAARVYTGAITTVDSGGAGGGVDPDCVAEGQWVGRTSGGPVLAQNLRLETRIPARSDGGTFSLAPVTRNTLSMQPCVRITTDLGAELTCSMSTPFILQAGGTVLAPAMLGQRVLVWRKVDQPGAMFDADHLIWETVCTVEYVGEQPVRHISIGGQSFPAGADPRVLVFSHNSTLKP